MMNSKFITLFIFEKKFKTKQKRRDQNQQQKKTISVVPLLKQSANDYIICFGEINFSKK